MKCFAGYVLSMETEDGLSHGCLSCDMQGQDNVHVAIIPHSLSKLSLAPSLAGLEQKHRRAQLPHCASTLSNREHHFATQNPRKIVQLPFPDPAYRRRLACVPDQSQLAPSLPSKALRPSLSHWVMASSWNCELALRHATSFLYLCCVIP